MLHHLAGTQCRVLDFGIHPGDGSCVTILGSSILQGRLKNVYARRLVREGAKGRRGREFGPSCLSRTKYFVSVFRLAGPQPGGSPGWDRNVAAVLFVFFCQTDSGSWLSRRVMGPSVAVAVNTYPSPGLLWSTRDVVYRSVEKHHEVDTCT